MKKFLTKKTIKKLIPLAVLGGIAATAAAVVVARKKWKKNH